MNILLIGNGFDIAHGLPTRYTDFFEWIEAFMDRKEDRDAFCHEDYDTYFAEMFESKRENLINEIKDLVYDNIWVEYFEAYKESSQIKENWIDFEREISKLVKSIDHDMINGDEDRFERYEIVNNLSNDFLKEKYSKNMMSYRAINNLYGDGNSKTISYGAIIDKLHLDLDRISRALEIYLSDYIGEVNVKRRLSDIEGISVDKVLSFNYTNTFSRLYDIEEAIDYDYIHGKANVNNSISTNNIVLGIDEYLPEDKKNDEIDFIAFKKYYQRICKGTGSKYKQWIEQIVYDETRKKNWVYDGKDHSRDHIHYLYIFGHSLDVTDKDILRELVLHSNVETTIYYYETIDEQGQSDNGRIDLGHKIANLVKVIGQDELIKRTGGRTKTIEFKLQSSTTNSGV